MRKVQIWRGSDNRIYAIDESTQEQFYLPDICSAASAGVTIYHALAEHNARIYGAFVEWLAEETSVLPRMELLGDYPKLASTAERVWP